LGCTYLRSMTMRRLTIFGVVLTTAILLMIGIFKLLVVKDVGVSFDQGEGVSGEVASNETDPIRDRQVLTATNVVLEDDIELFVYNNGDPNDFFHGFKSFGAVDKLGVNSTVLNAHPAERDDFEAIARKKSDREQFLVGKGILLTNEDRRWHVLVELAVTIGSDVRLNVSASVGNDVTENGGIRMGVEQTIHEIWKLDPTGNVPILLDRSLEYFDGVSTHAEVPPIDQNLTWPAGTFGFPPERP